MVSDAAKVVAVVTRWHDDIGELQSGAASSNGRVLVCGSDSSAVHMYRLRSDRKGKSVSMLRSWTLFGHTAAVRCVAVCDNYSIAVSGSDDHTCIIWDLNRASFVRSLNHHEGPVTCVAISRTRGDIVSVCARSSGGCVLRLWTINGKLVAAQETSAAITCICLTSVIEGTGTNAVIAGDESGLIYAWNLWDLSPLECNAASLKKRHNAPIVAIAVNVENTDVVTADAQGKLVSWQPDPKKT